MGGRQEKAADKAPSISDIQETLGKYLIVSNYGWSGIEWTSIFLYVQCELSEVAQYCEF